MKALLMATLLITGLLSAPAQAWAPLAQVFPAPVDRVWTATLAAVETQWGLDESDRTIGAIRTRSHRIEGDRPSLWSKTLRVRLRVSVIPLDDSQTRVIVTRELFRRERLPWGERDERTDVNDPAQVAGELERHLLRAIARTL